MHKKVDAVIEFGIDVAQTACAQEIVSFRPVLMFVGIVISMNVFFSSWSRTKKQ